MTEIQFLCDLLLNTKCPRGVKDKIISRIGEVESQLALRAPQIPRPQPMGIGIQAPSTQRLLDEQPVILPPIIRAPSGPIDKETGTVIITKADGTRGPRKF